MLLMSKIPHFHRWSYRCDRYSKGTRYIVYRCEKCDKLKLVDWALERAIGN